MITKCAIQTDAIQTQRSNRRQVSGYPSNLPCLAGGSMAFRILGMTSLLGAKASRLYLAFKSWRLLRYYSRLRHGQS